MSSSLTFREAKTLEDYLLAYSLISILNTDLNKEQYLMYSRDMLALGNYVLVLAYNEDILIGACGYWIATKFYSGKYMEIDNFIINLGHQSKGYGSIFLDYLEEIAKNESCETIMLDAFLENKDGHRFYNRNGYVAKGYHFLKKI